MNAFEKIKTCPVCGKRLIKIYGNHCDYDSVFCSPTKRAGGCGWEKTYRTTTEQKEEETK